MLFNVADVQIPILGADFLQTFGISIDFPSRCLKNCKNEIICTFLNNDRSVSNVLETSTSVLNDYNMSTEPCRLVLFESRKDSDAGIPESKKVNTTNRSDSSNENVLLDDISSMNGQMTIGKLLRKYVGIFEDRVTSDCKHGVFHHIILDDQPRMLKPYRLPLAYHAGLKERFDHMLESGIIRVRLAPMHRH